MALISLAQALKQKNRLSKEVKELTERINKWNSVMTGAERAIDVPAAYEELKTKTAALAKLKAEIQRGNGPILEKIFLMAELRGLQASLSRLNTTHGPSSVGYSGEVTDYEAALNGAFVIQEQSKVTDQLNSLQDEVDLFNATTMIEVTLD